MEFFFSKAPGLLPSRRKARDPRRSAPLRVPARLWPGRPHSLRSLQPRLPGGSCVAQAARLVNRATSCIPGTRTASSEMIHLPAAGIAGPPVAPPASAPDESYQRAPRPSFAPSVTPEVQLGPSKPSRRFWVAALALATPPRARRAPRRRESRRGHEVRLKAPESGGQTTARFLLLRPLSVGSSRISDFFRVAASRGTKFVPRPASGHGL